MKVAILHSCFSECKLTLLDESGHSQCLSLRVQNDLVGWKWPFSSFAPQSAEWPRWLKVAILKFWLSGYENALNKDVRSTVHFLGFEKPMISQLGYEKPVKLSNCHFIGVEMPMIFHINSKSPMKSFWCYVLHRSWNTYGLPVAHALHMLTRQLHSFKLKSG